MLSFRSCTRGPYTFVRKQCVGGRPGGATGSFSYLYTPSQTTASSYDISSLLLGYGFYGVERVRRLYPLYGTD